MGLPYISPANPTGQRLGVRRPRRCAIGSNWGPVGAPGHDWDEILSDNDGHSESTTPAKN